MAKTLLRTLGWMLCGVVLSLVAVRALASQAVLVPNPQDVRFQLIGNEPIAAPDGRSIVTGWDAFMFKDRQSGQCFVAFQHRDGVGVQSVGACPR